LILNLKRVDYYFLAVKWLQGIKCWLTIYFQLLYVKTLGECKIMKQREPSLRFIMDTGLSISGPAEHNNGCRDPLQTGKTWDFLFKK
jgi:hypothetical protein